jgi:hypothetical protein
LKQLETKTLVQIWLPMNTTFQNLPRRDISHVKISNRCAPWKMSSGAEKFVLQALQFQNMVICRELPGRASISHFTSNVCFAEGQFNVSA